MLTITGPGGIGKTSTAIELCRRMVPDFLDGISFIPMADVTDADSPAPIIDQEGRDAAEPPTPTSAADQPSATGW